MIRKKTSKKPRPNKPTAKKKPKLKVASSNLQKHEASLRAKHKAAGTGRLLTGRIGRLNAQVKSGLISVGERNAAVNKMK